MKILSLVTKLGALAGSLEIIDKVSKSESAQKAAIIATKTGKKVVGKVTRTDEIGNTIFKYNKRKLSKMYSKDKISEKVYDYLISEQKNLHHFAKDTKNIEKLFEAMIRVKDDKKLMKIIRKYEKIRDKYMAT